MSKNAFLEENWKRLTERICQASLHSGRSPQEIALVAVSKFQPADVVRAVSGWGFTAFGENRVQELLEKQALGAYGETPVHLIGTLQRNKVRKVVGRCTLIQSVDSPALAAEIAHAAAERDLCQDILLQVNIGREESKGGVLPEQLEELAAAVVVHPQIRLRGLMAIPPQTANSREQREYFARMRQLLVDLTRKKYDNVPIDGHSLDILSMGMSDDFESAIAEGSTMIRIGSALFGPRVPNKR